MLWRHQEYHLPKLLKEETRLTGEKEVVVSWPPIILGMGSVNESRRYKVTSPLFGWGHAQNDLWMTSSWLPARDANFLRQNCAPSDPFLDGTVDAQLTHRSSAPGVQGPIGAQGQAEMTSTTHLEYHESLCHGNAISITGSLWRGPTGQICSPHKGPVICGLMSLFWGHLWKSDTWNKHEK